MKRLRTVAVWVGLILTVIVVTAWLDSGGGASDGGGWLIGLVALLVLAVLGIVAFRVWQAVAGRMGKQWSDMARSKARLLEDAPDTRFTDVGGCHEAKDRLQDLVDFLQNPEAWEASGARAPRGILLEGPPGTGKTHLARAVAGEAGVRFFEASGSEFVEMLVGVGAARVRDLFEAAAEVAPAVIFIDELDALGRRRGSGALPFNEEREQSLNQLLTSMDGFRRTDRIVVIGATNRADVLDPALVRPGRFDVLLSLPALDDDARTAVLEIHGRGKPLAPSVELAAWSARTRGATGAMLEQLLNEAALIAVRARQARDGTVEIRDADLAQAWATVTAKPGGLAGLDQALVGSAWQLVRPDTPLALRGTLTGAQIVEGELDWADGAFLKIRKADGAEVAIAKNQVVTLEHEPAVALLPAAGESA